jgi:hypothetical protein
MRPSLPSLLALTLLAWAASPASAGEVYFQGDDEDGLRWGVVLELEGSESGARLRQSLVCVERRAPVFGSVLEAEAEPLPDEPHTWGLTVFSGRQREGVGRPLTFEGECAPSFVNLSVSPFGRPTDERVLAGSGRAVPTYALLALVEGLAREDSAVLEQDLLGHDLTLERGHVLRYAGQRERKQVMHHVFVDTLQGVEVATYWLDEAGVLDAVEYASGRVLTRVNRATFEDQLCSQAALAAYLEGPGPAMTLGSRPRAGGGATDVHVGQRYHYAIKAGAGFDFELVWEVLEITDAGVRYRMTSVMNGNPLGDAQEQTWDPSQDHAVGFGQEMEFVDEETIEVGDHEFDCHHFRGPDGSEVWVPYDGDEPMFPGFVRTTAQGTTVELLRIEDAEDD